MQELYAVLCVITAKGGDDVLVNSGPEWLLLLLDRCDEKNLFKLPPTDMAMLECQKQRP